MLLQSKNISRLIWGGFALLFLLTLIVPRVDFSRTEESPRAEARPDFFSDEIIAAERALHSGTLDTVDEERARQLLPLLKIRALAASGPMTPGEMQETLEFFNEYAGEIASQENQVAKITLRNHRNRLIFESLPRLDPEAGTQAIDQVREAYNEAFGTDI